MHIFLNSLNSPTSLLFIFYAKGNFIDLLCFNNKVKLAYDVSLNKIKDFHQLYKSLIWNCNS